MSAKLTYQELEQQVQELKQRVRELKGAESENNITKIAPINLEPFFNPLFQKHDAVMLLIEPNSGVIINANIAAQNFYGYSIATLKQMKIQEINILSKDEIAEKRQQAAIEKCNCFEFPHRLSSGEIRIVEIHSSPILLDDEKYLLSIIHDITDRKKAEEHNRMIAEMLNSAPSSISIHDFDGRFLHVNRKTFEVHGYEEDEFMALSLHDLNVPESKTLIKDRMNTIIEKGEASFVATHIRKDGSTIPMEVYVKKVYWGNKPAMLSVATDITERIRSEKELKEFRSNLLALFENTEDIMVLRDTDGKAVVYNKAFAQIVEELFGVKATPGVRTLDYLPEDKKDHWEKVLSKVHSGIGHKEEYGWVFKKELRYFETSQNPIKVDDKIVGSAEITRDITNRKLSEEKFRQMAERLDLAARAAQLGIWDWDIPDDVLIWNDKMYELYGMTEKDTTNNYDTWLNGLHTDDREKHDKLIDLVLQGEREFDTEFRVVWQDGTVRYIKAHGQVTRDSNGDPIRMTGINYDITEQKEMEARVQQAQKMESIGNLAGGIAHDFNNILFPIIGMSEMLLEDLPPKSIERDNAEEIYKAGIRGSDLVKQILAFSRQSEHKMMPIQIQNVLKEVIKLSRSTIPTYIEIKQDIQQDCGIVLADPSQIHQIGMNIITNAYHAVEDTGGTISIKLKQTATRAPESAEKIFSPNSYAVLSISDNGHGMSEELIEKIFDPYFTTKEKGKGTGLGLAMVYGIVKEHGGDIRVYSKIGRGSTFEIYFPLMDKLQCTESTPEIGEYQEGKERILLVDDEEPVAKLEKQMLERLGYMVTMRVNSLEALEEFKAKPDVFDMVISDMTMPNMTGDRLAREMIAIRPDIPIIICTGFSERLNQEKAASIGVKAFLMKPIVKSDMAKMVRKVLDEAKSGDNET